MTADQLGAGPLRAHCLMAAERNESSSGREGRARISCGAAMTASCRSKCSRAVAHGRSATAHERTSQSMTHRSLRSMRGSSATPMNGRSSTTAIEERDVRRRHHGSWHVSGCSMGNSSVVVGRSSHSRRPRRRDRPDGASGRPRGPAIDSGAAHPLTMRSGWSSPRLRSPIPSCWDNPRSTTRTCSRSRSGCRCRTRPQSRSRDR